MLGVFWIISSALVAPSERAAISASNTSACPPSPSRAVATSLLSWKITAAAPTLKKPALLILEPSVYIHSVLGFFWRSVKVLMCSSRALMLSAFWIQG